MARLLSELLASKGAMQRWDAKPGGMLANGEAGVGRISAASSASREVPDMAGLRELAAVITMV